MKRYILKAAALLVLGGSLVSCDKFLDTKYYTGVDRNEALTSVPKLKAALNGTYYQFFHYTFAGNYAVNIGDISSDLAFWNTKAQHFNKIYQYNFMDTDTYLADIWSAGYAVADNAARVIEAGETLYEGISADEKDELDVYIAEAYALRAYAQFILVNVYGHQVKVGGKDFSAEPGIVVIEKPIAPKTEVSRSTVGKTYEAILSDLQAAINHFEAAKTARGSLFRINPEAVYGLRARVHLYLEKFDEAAADAEKALELSEISTLTYDAEKYRALYAGGTSNSESIFAIDINDNQNWSANSSGTLWSSYGYLPSFKVLGLYKEKDCRKSIIETYINSNNGASYYTGGKFSVVSNPAAAPMYMINAAEMFLIVAEAKLRSTTAKDVDAAKKALLTVAKRNAAITAESDLPSSEAELFAFIKDERARELFQEGLRLYDLRRWGEKASVFATPHNDGFTYNGYEISDLVYPVPSGEITSGWGVEQTEGWFDTLPKKK